MFLIIFGIVLYFILVLDCSWSDYFLSKKLKGNSKGEVRGKIIEKCNHKNLVFSGVFMVLSFLLVQVNLSYLGCFLLGFNGYRFFSRSHEIIFAFSNDVFTKEVPQSGKYLDNFKRLKLALISYLEIFLYSASFYVTIINSSDISTGVLVLKSFLMSLSVGTLTNVGFSQSSDLLPLWGQLLSFLQVFTSLSLIVLSLTMYVSRSPSFYEDKT